MEKQNNQGSGVSSDFRKRDTSPIYASESQTAQKNTQRDLVSQINMESLSELNSQVSQLQKDLDKERNTSIQLNVKLEEVTKSLKNKETYQKGLQTKTRNALLKVDELTEEIEKLKGSSTVGSTSDDKELILSLENQIQRINVELEQTRKESISVTSELTSLQKKHDSLVQQAEQALAFKDVHEGVQKALDSANAEIAKLQIAISDERKTAESNEQRLVSEIEYLTGQLTSLKEGNSLDEKLVSGLKAQLTKLGAELAQAKQENIALQENASTLQANSQEVAELQKSLQSMTEQYEALVSDLLNKVPKEELETANNKNSSLTEELQKVQQELSTSNSTINNLKNEVATIQEQHSNCVDKEQLNTLDLAYKKLEADLTAALSENEKLVITVAQLRQELEGKDTTAMDSNRIYELEKELATAQAEKESLATLCDSLEQRAITAETKANAFKDLEALYNGVLKDLVSINPKASDDFDNLLGKYIGGREYLIDLLD